MNEEILSIKEVGWMREEYEEEFEGYEVKTDKQTIQILIESQQCCCEDSGYMVSEDDLDSFVGAKIRAISVTDTTHNTKMIKKFDFMRYPLRNYDNGESSIDVECGGIEFVNIDTDRGELQFVVYNCHNGYYGHDILIRFNGEEISDIL